LARHIFAARRSHSMDMVLNNLINNGALSGGGLGAIAALLMILAAWVLLPAEERRPVRLPLVFLALCGVAWTAAVFYAYHSAPARLLRLAQLFLLLAALGRSAFLIVVHAVLARRLAFPLPRIVQDIIQIGVYGGVALITLRAAGVEPGSLLATSALLTAV